MKISTILGWIAFHCLPIWELMITVNPPILKMWFMAMQYHFGYMYIFGMLHTIIMNYPLMHAESIATCSFGCASLWNRNTVCTNTGMASSVILWCNCELCTHLWRNMTMPIDTVAIFGGRVYRIKQCFFIATRLLWIIWSFCCELVHICHNYVHTHTLGAEKFSTSKWRDLCCHQKGGELLYF